MKKKFVLLSLLVLLSLALYAQSSSETEENLTYLNVDIILKIYNSFTLIFLNFTTVPCPRNPI